MSEFKPGKIVEGVYHHPKNYLEKITEVYCFVSSDENGEGIIAQTMDSPMGRIQMPFVCADKDRMESLKPFAIQATKQSGVKIKIIKLTNREEIEDINP